MTQAEPAELVDLNIRTVQKIEAGHINMLITTAIRIQGALNCPWEKFLP
jgi:DNA-binding XRE family transcriptional regulator